jgi:hypothetical protein
MITALLLLACSSPTVTPVPQSVEPAPAPPSAPSLTVHLRGEQVRVELAHTVPVRFGMAETEAHEHPWNGEDCAVDTVCHTLTPGENMLTQVHHLGEIEPGRTLFDNHFGGQLSYVVRGESECWSTSEAHFGAECQSLEVKELVEELEHGHVEPTHWKDPAVPKLAATPEHHGPVPKAATPTPAHTKQLQTFREAHKPAAKYCCKTCRKGIPCGNSCISASKRCRSLGGCAC